MNINQSDLAGALVLTTSDSNRRFIVCTSVGVYATYATFVAQPCTGAYNLINEKTIYIPVFIALQFPSLILG